MLNNNHRQYFLKKQEEWAEGAYRVLAFARKGFKGNDFRKADDNEGRAIYENILIYSKLNEYQGISPHHGL